MSYNNIGKIVQKLENVAETATYDSQDRLTKLGSTTYSFNADGFLTNRGGDTFTYSATGELLTAAAGGKTVTCACDGTGRRVARTVGTQTWQYLYGNLGSPFQLTATKEPGGTLTSYYYDGGGRLFAFDRGTTRYYVACDQVGTPKVVTDAAGTVVKKLDYDSFGQLIADSALAFYLPIGFAGGLADADTGLVRFGFRDYDPATGRWTAKDPVVFEGGTNLYAYVENDPVNLIDPTGEFAIFAPIVWAALRGAVIGGGADLLMQLVRNGGKAGCVDWGEVGEAALAGGLLGGAGKWYKTGYEITFKLKGKDVRIAPFGNRKGDKYGEWPHYHKNKKIPGSNDSYPGQGIGRHRPWETSKHDTSFGDRF